MINSDYIRKQDESDLEYAMRLIGIKKELRPGDLDWCDITELLGLDYNPDSLRKSQDSPYGGWAVYNAMKQQISNKSQEELKVELATELQELKKMKCSIADERAALNKLIREQSRIDHIEKIAMKCAKELAPLEQNKICSLQERKVYGSQTLLITLSDLHYGLEIDEFNNKFNKEIFHNRLNYLYDSAIDIILNNENLEQIVVLGLGDFISGLIHNVIRIEARENVVQQVVSVSNALIHLLDKLSRYLPIQYFDCVGNHSRLFEDKNNCLSKESFDILIHYILEQKFANDDLVTINQYTINERIGEFELYGKHYAFCHGDNFNIGSLAQDLSLMTQKFYEAIFIGHIHHVFVEEQNGVMVIANGSLAGNDEFANKIRKSSKPSQNMFIISEQGIDSMMTIRLER